MMATGMDFPSSAARPHGVMATRAPRISRSISASGTRVVVPSGDNTRRLWRERLTLDPLAWTVTVMLRSGS